MWVTTYTAAGNGTSASGLPDSSAMIGQYAWLWKKLKNSASSARWSTGSSARSKYRTAELPHTRSNGTDHTPGTGPTRLFR